MALTAKVLICWSSLLFLLSCTIPPQDTAHFVAPHPIINEIMMNPNGTDLPAREWLELYNPSDVAILLSNYSLTYNNRAFPFPEIFIPARQYMIVTASQNEQALLAFGNVCGLVGWPTMSNTGATLALVHHEIGTVDHVAYTNRWYATVAKRQGGWSLERINPEFSCNPAQAWQESVATEGATPGRQNSVFRAGVIPNVQINQTIVGTNSVTFVANMDLENMLSVDQIRTDNEQLRITKWELSRDSIHLFFDQDMPVGLPFVASMNGRFCGREVTFSQSIFAETELLYNDVVINEVLFNPFTGSPTFVEIFNRSDKIINLQNWRLGNRVLTNQALLFHPNTYQVITTNPTMLQRDYPSARLESVIVLPSLPAFANLQGIVTIFSPQALMDSLRYTADMHQPFIRNARGVSLERISTSVPTNEAGNFISASTYSEGATPGYENSRIREGTITQNKVYLASRTISPNREGPDRLLYIHYEFIKENTMINMNIYDDKGRRINRVVRNQGVGYTGRITWNGLQENGQLARPGVYLMWMETYHENGKQETFKESFVIRY